METLSIVVNAVVVAGIGGILVWTTTRLERRIEQVDIALAVGARPRAQDG